MLNNNWKESLNKKEMNEIASHKHHSSFIIRDWGDELDVALVSLNNVTRLGTIKDKNTLFTEADTIIKGYLHNEIEKRKDQIHVLTGMISDFNQ